MGFTLAEVVPWGRSYDEYLSMFALSPSDLKKRFIGCGDGPASFNSILTERGGSIISIDPVYEFSAEEIENRIDQTHAVILDQARRNMDEFVWENISSVEELGRIRMAAMETFLRDFARGRKEGRYVAGSLPDLPFHAGEFDIALCSHFLFLYSDQLSEDFHLESIRELCRVAGEVRIFPLLELGSKKSRHLEAVMAQLEKEHRHVRICKVPYEFQKGGNKMLVVK